MFGFGKHQQDDKGMRFSEFVTPHLDAAYKLARWLARNDHDARDLAQEAVMRAWQYFGSFRGDEGKPWLLGIVRRVFLDWRARQVRQMEHEEPLDAELEDAAADESIWAESPQAWAERLSDANTVHAALEALPLAFREVLVLRELEEMSYKEIASVVGVPVGTVMSRLSRGREMMLVALKARGVSAYERTR